MKALKKIGKVLLVLLGCIMMPVLIWVALGAAIYLQAKARKTHTVAAPSFGQILTAGFKR